MAKFATIQKMTPRHYRILDLYIQGLTINEIAEVVGMTRPSVSVITNAPCFQHEAAIRRKAFEEDIDEKLAEKTSEAREILQKSAGQAAKVLCTMLSDKGASRSIRLKSAESILDRTGHAKQQRVDSENNTIVNMKREDLELLNETLALEKSIIEHQNRKVESVVVSNGGSEIGN
jgi:hypothetical protein